MKLDYNILWLDDQIDAFIDDDFIDSVQEHLTEEGFNANVIAVSKQEEFFENLNDSLDLILTDYNMSGKNGAQVIAEVREKCVFTEILFYTAQTEWEDIGKIDRISFLQTSKIAGGTHHEKVTNEALRLIDLTIRKFQHIVAMRGMIMHETSSLDAQSMDILKTHIGCGAQNCQECANKEKCTPISDIIFDKLEAHLWGKMEDVCKYKENKNFKKLLADTFLFSADYKVEALSKILTDLNLNDFSRDYKQEIISTRNKFAHAVLLRDEAGREYFKFGADGLTFDATYCKTIRENINKHKKNLDDLLGHI